MFLSCPLQESEERVGKRIHLYFYLMRELFSKIHFFTFIDFLYIKHACKFV